MINQIVLDSDKMEEKSIIIFSNFYWSCNNPFVKFVFKNLQFSDENYLYFEKLILPKELYDFSSLYNDFADNPSQEIISALDSYENLNFCIRNLSLNSFYIKPLIEPSNEPTKQIFGMDYCAEKNINLSLFFNASLEIGNEEKVFFKKFYFNKFSNFSLTSNYESENFYYVENLVLEIKNLVIGRNFITYKFDFSEKPFNRAGKKSVLEVFSKVKKTLWKKDFKKDLSKKSFNKLTKVDQQEFYHCCSFENLSTSSFFEKENPKSFKTKPKKYFPEKSELCLTFLPNRDVYSIYYPSDKKAFKRLVNFYRSSDELSDKIIIIFSDSFEKVLFNCEDSLTFYKKEIIPFE